MKKNIKSLNIFLLVSALFITISCTDAIEITQPGRLGADQAFKNVNDLQLGLSGVYSTFDHSSEIQFNALFTDELSIGFDNGGQGLGNGTYGFVLNPGSAISGALWAGYYNALVQSNLLLDATENITPEASEQADFNDVRGQALALRAYAHFQLLAYYSPDLTDDSSPGVIIMDRVPGVDETLPRNTTGEVFTAILNDLTEAEPLIQDDENATFVSKSFVTALRARIALYRKQYATADGLAQDVLADFPIVDRTAYANIFTDLGNDGVIFKLERTIGDGYDRQGATGSAAAGGWAGANFAFVNASVDGSPYFEMGRSLFNLLDPDDIRYDVNVHPSSVVDPDYANSANPRNSDILAIGKYTGSEGQPLMNDLKIFRSAEFLLIRAEAAAANNNLVAAAGFIKQLRDARFTAAQPLPVYGNRQEALRAVLNERRIELAFEGHRWLDLKRLGVDAGVGVERDPIDCAVNGACTLAANDFRMRSVPVPLAELNANPVIAQNPGY